MTDDSYDNRPYLIYKTQTVGQGYELVRIGSAEPDPSHPGGLYAMFRECPGASGTVHILPSKKGLDLALYLVDNDFVEPAEQLIDDIRQLVEAFDDGSWESADALSNAIRKIQSEITMKFSDRCMTMPWNRKR